MTPKLPALLVRYIQQKRCVVFAGAGLSAGAGLPTWKGLLIKGIEELIGSLPEGDLHQEELRRLVDYGKLLEVADFCKEKLGSAYHQFLAEQVRGDQAQLPLTHQVLMQLPFSAWVTTNYDKLLERAYADVKGGFPKTLTHKDTEALGRLLFDGGQFILKAHGDIDRPETVVLTSRDYSEIIHANPAFNEIFSGLLLTKALFFVGYSLSDPDFRLLMDRQLSHFKGFVPERYALMTGVGPVEREVLWRTARIQVISYENTSGKHAEVLEFLKNLKDAVHPKPMLESVQMKAATSIPPPAAAPQPGKIVSQNTSGGSKPSEAQWVFEAYTAPAPAPPQAVKSPAVRSPRHQLFIERMQGRVQLRLVRGDSEPVVQGTAATRLEEDVGLSLKEAVERGADSHAWLYTQLMERLLKHLPREVLEALGESSTQAPLVLHLAPELARFPWELLPLQGQAVCLKRELVRAPVGVPAQVRGTPLIRVRPRILFIEGKREGRAGPRELEHLAKLYATSNARCTVLQGEDATFERVMAELAEGQDDELPDLVYYTGEVGQVGSELSLKLPGLMDLPAGALRSVLSRGRLPFLVMNAPSSAFALSLPSSRTAIFEGREGFMDQAVQLGVGAFVGAFDRPGAQAGTAFMAALHRALATGSPIAEAVHKARGGTHRQDDPTALQYVLSGDGELQLVDSLREDAPI
jgi:hypothetical protein